jgi:hypothetical protein
MDGWARRRVRSDAEEKFCREPAVAEDASVGQGVDRQRDVVLLDPADEMLRAWCWARDRDCRLARVVGRALQAVEALRRVDLE